MNHMNHEFDELIRLKLADYSEPPDMKMLDQIHTKKNRVLKWYGLYRLLIIGSAIGLGLWGSYELGNRIADSRETISHNEVIVPGNRQDIRVSDAFGTSSAMQATVPGEADGILSYPSNSKNRGVVITDKTALHHASSQPQAATGSGKHTVSPENGNDKLSNATRQHNEKQYSGKQAAQTAAGKSNAGNGTNNHVTNVKGLNGTKHNNPGKSAGKATLETEGVSDQNDKKVKSVKETGADPDVEKQGKDKDLTTCNAKFGYYISYNGEVNFTNFSEMEAGSRVRWEFGDGQTSAKSDPAHTYQKAGTYNVALHIINSSNRCESSFNKLVSIGGPSGAPVHIKGVVRASGQELGNAMVELLKYDETQNGYEVFARTTSSNSGSFDFSPVKQGRYLMRAYPTDKTPGFFTTYFGNTRESHLAAEVVVSENESDLSGYNIELFFAGTEPGAAKPGSLLADNSAERKLLIFDLYNNLVGTTSVDANGNFSLSGIGAGNYRVFDPVTGKSSNDPKLSSGSSGNTSDLVGGETGGNGVVAEKLTLSPNPARDVVNFGLENADATEMATVVIVNASGVEVMRRQQSVGPNFSNSQLDVSQLSPGVYYVMVFRGNKKVISNRLVKQFELTR